MSNAVPLLHGSVWGGDSNSWEVCCKAGDGNTPPGIPTKLPTTKWIGPLVSKKLSIQQLQYFKVQKMLDTKTSSGINWCKDNWALVIPSLWIEHESQYIMQFASKHSTYCQTFWAKRNCFTVVSPDCEVPGKSSFRITWSPAGSPRKMLCCCSGRLNSLLTPDMRTPDASGDMDIIALPSFTQ